jgi:DnaJ-class molecular chaperone
MPPLPNVNCKACQGSGKNSKGTVCFPCQGTGKRRFKTNLQDFKNATTDSIHKATQKKSPPTKKKKPPH